MPEAGLSTTPVAADRPLGWIILATWVAPALTVAAAKAPIMLFHPAEAPLTILLTTGLYLGWVALTLLPTWRGLLIDIGRLLLARVSFVVWVTLACILVVIGSSQPLDSPWWALTVWVICDALAAAYVDVRASRKRFVFTMAVLGFAGLLLVAVDTWLASHVLPVMVHNVFVEHEPVLGWRLRPNTTIIRRREGAVLKETINDQGFRTRGGLGARQPGVKRLLFLGDSHTEAYDVDDPNTYTALVEQRMSQTRPVEVLSLGSRATPPTRSCSPTCAMAGPITPTSWFFNSAPTIPRSTSSTDTGAAASRASSGMATCCSSRAFRFPTTGTRSSSAGACSSDRPSCSRSST